MGRAPIDCRRLPTAMVATPSLEVALISCPAESNSVQAHRVSSHLNAWIARLQIGWQHPYHTSKISIES